MTFGGHVYAQSSSSSSTDVLKPCEQAVDELKLKRAEVDALKNQLAAMQEQLKLQEQLTASKQEQIEILKQANAARAGANNLDLRIEAMYRDEIADYKARNAELEAKITKLEKSLNKWRLFGVGATAATVFTMKR